MQKRLALVAGLSLADLQTLRQEAEQHGDFAKAVTYHDAYQKAWEAAKKAEEQAQVEALNQAMGVRLVEEKNRALQHENDRQASRLRTAERLQVFLKLLIGLGAGILLLLLVNLKQRKHLDRSEKKLRVFLDSIDEALLLVDRRGRIDPDKSPVLASDKTLLPDLLEQLQIPPSDAKHLLNHLRSSGQSEWTTLDQRILSVRWLPLVDRTLVILRDVTRQKALEQMLSEQQKKLAQLPRPLQELAAVSLSQGLVLIQKSDQVARLVHRAELLFFSGGNQAHYVAWKNSRLMPAVQEVFQRGGVVGGTSAGLAILGSSVFDARLAGTSNVSGAPFLVSDHGNGTNRNCGFGHWARSGGSSSWSQ